MGLKEKIGIACGCRKLNYGSILQSFALCEYIKKQDYECEFVWMKGSIFKHYNIRLGKIAGVIINAVKHPSIIPKVLKSVKRVSSKGSSYAMSPKTKQLFEKFIDEYISIKLYSWRELKDSERLYEKFVCGSDQIWNSYEYYLDPMYFLRFTPQKKRIAYAPSFGTNTVSYYNRTTLIKYLSGFDCISVREESGSRICKDLIGRDVPIVVDPTLLLSKKQWIEALTLSEKHEDYCFAYFLNEPNPAANELLNRIRTQLPIKAVPIKYECFRQEEVIAAGPKEFLELLMNARYVITDSFHGTILSINFQKQFICFERQYGSKIKQSSRITDILKRFDLIDRYNVDSEKMMNILKEPIDYVKVGNKLNAFKTESSILLNAFLEA